MATSEEDKEVLVFFLDRDVDGVTELLIQDPTLITCKDEEKGVTPLLAASYEGDLPVVQYLVERGADLKERTNNGATPLLAASYGGHLPVVQYLVEKGADLKERDNDGNTPLLLASYWGHLPVVQYLVEKGANLKERDNDGATPFLLASQGGYLRVVQYLVEKGADLKEKNNNGYNAVYHASYSDVQAECLEYFIYNGLESDQIVKPAEGFKFGVFGLLVAVFQLLTWYFLQASFNNTFIDI